MLVQPERAVLATILGEALAGEQPTTDSQERTAEYDWESVAIRPETIYEKAQQHTDWNSTNWSLRFSFGSWSDQSLHPDLFALSRTRQSHHVSFLYIHPYEALRVAAGFDCAYGVLRQSNTLGWRVLQRAFVGWHGRSDSVRPRLLYSLPFYWQIGDAVVLMFIIACSMACTMHTLK